MTKEKYAGKLFNNLFYSFLKADKNFFLNCFHYLPPFDKKKNTH